MKTDTKRYERASKDIADRIRKLLSDVKPTIQTKHGLDDQTLDLAVTRGVGAVVIECAKKADVPTEAMGIEGYQPS